MSITHNIGRGKSATVISAIEAEIRRYGKLSAHDKRLENYRQAEVLRGIAAAQFAALNGWHAVIAFTPDELGRRGTNYGLMRSRDVGFFDHPLFFGACGRNVALVGQPYSNSVKVDDFYTYAERRGLEAHVPSNPRASFWNPPDTLFLVLTRPGVTVRWLPEQSEVRS